MQTTADLRADDAAPPPELTAPFGADERNAMLDAVFAQVDRAAPDTKVRSIESASRGPRVRTGMLVGFALAIAAALVLWIARPGPVEPALPDYTLTELRGGVMSVRSEPGSEDRALQIAPTDRIDVVVSPATAVQGPIVVDVIAQAAGQSTQMARVPAQVSASGAIRLTGSLQDWLALEPGEWTLVLAIAPADRAPESVEEALNSAEVRRVVVHARVTPPP